MELVCDAANSLDDVYEQFSLSNESIKYFDWICNRCRLFLTDSDPITAQKARQLKRAVETLNSEGIVFAANEVSTFRSYLVTLQTINPATIPKIVYVFGRYMEKMIGIQSQKFQSYSPSNKKRGKVYCNNTIFNPLSIPYVYHQHVTNQKLKSEVEAMQRTAISTEIIRLLVKKQTALFPLTTDH